MNAPWIKRPSPAFVVAMIALFVGLTGTAGAVATQVVPLAKRALVAENAKKLGGRRRRRSAAEPGTAGRSAGLAGPRAGQHPAGLVGRSPVGPDRSRRRGRVPGRVRRRAEGHRRRILLERIVIVSTRTRPATRPGAWFLKLNDTAPASVRLVRNLHQVGAGRGWPPARLRSAPAAACFSDQAASGPRPGRRRHGAEHDRRDAIAIHVIPRRRR